jgi:hypothetical protein
VTTRCLEPRLRAPADALGRIAERAFESRLGRPHVSCTRKQPPQHDGRFPGPIRFRIASQKKIEGRLGVGPASGPIESYGLPEGGVLRQSVLLWLRCRSPERLGRCLEAPSRPDESGSDFLSLCLWRCRS